MKGYTDLFVIEDDTLKEYRGRDKIVIVPDGVRWIGGIISGNDLESGSPTGDPIGYKAFYGNGNVESIYLPDSVERLGFKSLEGCRNLSVLAFSHRMKEVDVNALEGCASLKTIIYRGTVFEATKLNLEGNLLDLDTIHCIDGSICFHDEYYIDTLYFPGTHDTWSSEYEGTWVDIKSRRVVYLGDSTN